MVYALDQTGRARLQRLVDRLVVAGERRAVSAQRDEE